VFTQARTGNAPSVDPVTETPTQPSDYAALNAVWGALATGLLAATRDDAPPAGELPIFGLATFALTKALAKEKVGTWVRDPLVDESNRKPKGSGLRYAAGELLTCTRCLGTWSSLGLVGLRIARPREGRILASVLATAAVNDFLQAGFTALTNRSNVLEHAAQNPDRVPEDTSARFSSAAAG
jgi:hypothetical protein